ncbi:MAG: spondin domain-containing protein, partial [Flavobacteriaceae bacterium]
VIFDYITNDLMLPAAMSNEMMPVGPGGSLTFTLEVPEGYKLGYNTMFVFSNDWFLAHDNSGFPLFYEDGTPVSGYGATEKSYLYDAGTEVDQTVGFGPDQAPFQSGPNTGAADSNNLIRRVMEIENVQFGKGPISSYAGVAGFTDPRGGYNIVKVIVEPN